MPAGPPICALRARARRTSGSGFSGWPTPRAQDAKHEAPTEYEMREHLEKHPQLHMVAHTLKGWATPKANHSKGARNPNTVLASQERRGCVTSRLDDQVSLIGWATPRARDGKGNGVSIARAAQGVADSLDLQCKTVSRNGMAPPPPLSARTDGRALPLNPRFSLWLQGYPATWADCAEAATPSSRKSRRSS